MPLLDMETREAIREGLGDRYDVLVRECICPYCKEPLVSAETIDFKAIGWDGPGGGVVLPLFIGCQSCGAMFLKSHYVPRALKNAGKRARRARRST